MGERQDSPKNEPQSGPSVGVDDSHSANSSVIVNMSPHSEKAVRAILSGRIRGSSESDDGCRCGATLRPFLRRFRVCDENQQSRGLGCTIHREQALDG